MHWMIVITVTCLFISVCQCAGIAMSELEEFNEFLQKTSQLDKILKKGNDVDDDSDEDELISDHAWEDSGKFEGDLILNERQRRLIVKDVAEGLARNGLTDSTKKWPNNEVIYYIQREHFSGDQAQAIQDGIDDLGRASCIKFRPYKKGDRDAVVIQGSRRGCFSQVGYQGGYQVLNLSGRHPVGRGCFRHGTVVHELLHTLGFFHMQSSPDRDDYIDVHWQNIVQPARHNFRKYSTFDVSDFGVGYDYDSVLHYSRRAFSSNGKDTLVPKQSGVSIGQRVGLSDKDTQKLNKMYCDSDSNNFEEEEKSTQKPIVTKNKSPKNKPFEGHGIGYHQGKTIVIKLPTAKTIKLSDLPTTHLFDDFSKAPEIVPSTLTEGFGIRQEITDSYKPSVYVNTDEFKEFIPIHRPYEKHDTTEETVTKINAEDKPTLTFIKDLSSEFQDTEKYNTKNVKDDLHEAFDRLGQIIKTHVFPSHAPNFSVYQKDYSDLYTPTKKYDPDPEIAKVDKAFHSSRPVKVQQDYKQKDESPRYDSQVTLPFIKTSEVPAFIRSDENRTSEETDPSYGTSYPFRKKYPENDKLEYSIIENNNSSEVKDTLSKDNGLFGYLVPINGHVYNIKPNEFIQDSHINAAYTNSAKKGSIIDGSPKDGQYEYDDKENFDTYGSLENDKQPYKLFGVIVPLANKWYNVDYEQPKYTLPLGRTNTQEIGR